MWESLVVVRYIQYFRYFDFLYCICSRLARPFVLGLGIEAELFDFIDDLSTAHACKRDVIAHLHAKTQTPLTSPLDVILAVSHFKLILVLTVSFLPNMIMGESSHLENTDLSAAVIK